MQRPLLLLLELEQMAVLDQLQLEEALLRADQRNICLINWGAAPAVVLGSSGQVADWVEPLAWERLPLPLIRRFSAGGTVVVDSSTLFITFIANGDQLQVEPFPKAIMEWTLPFYQPLFRTGSFCLRDNDYALGDRKCGGNAQYISRKRWLHHTSFLWDWSASHMELLKMPPRMPHWRQQRSHDQFLCRLIDWGVASPQAFFTGFKEQLSSHFSVEPLSLEEASSILSRPHRRTSCVLSSFPR